MRTLAGQGAGGTKVPGRIYERNARRRGDLTDANHVGKLLNRFRFIREPELVGYASGDTVYKYSTALAALAPQPLAATPADADEYGHARLSAYPSIRPQALRLCGSTSGTVSVSTWRRL